MQSVARDLHDINYILIVTMYTVLDSSELQGI